MHSYSSRDWSLGSSQRPPTGSIAHLVNEPQFFVTLVLSFLLKHCSSEMYSFFFFSFDVFFCFLSITCNSTHLNTNMKPFTVELVQ